MTARWSVIMVFVLTTSHAQELKVAPLEAAKIAEELFAQQDLDLNYEELYETVLQYLSSPLELNRAGVEELRSLFLMSEQQVQDLLAHRAKNGDLLSIYELQAIPSFNPEVIRRLAPFVTVSGGRSTAGILKRKLTEPNNYFL